MNNGVRLTIDAKMKEGETLSPSFVNFENIPSHMTKT